MTLNYDFNEASEGGDFVTLNGGRYIFKLIKVESGKSNAGNPKAVVSLAVVRATGSNKIFEDGVINQHMATTGKASFRFRDLLKALKVKTSGKGKVNLKKYYGKEIGALVTLAPGDDGDMMFNDLKLIVPGDQMHDILDDIEEDFDDDEEDEEDEVEEVEDDDDFDEDEDEDDEDEFDEDDEDDEGDEDDEEDEEITKADLREMDLDELKVLGKEWEVSTRKPRGKNLTKGIMRKRLADFIDSLDEDEEDDEEEPF